MTAGEYYPTPPVLAEAMARRLAGMLVCSPQRAPLVLEPSAGSGALTRAARAQLNPEAAIVALEPLQPPPPPSGPHASGASMWERARLEDAAERFRGAFDGVLMNPPYIRALEHVQLALGCLRPGGALVALLPLAFVSGVTRAAWLADHPPEWIHVIAPRPSFVWSHTCRRCGHRWTTEPDPAPSALMCGCGGRAVTGRTDARDVALFGWIAGASGAARVTWGTP